MMSDVSTNPVDFKPTSSALDDLRNRLAEAMQGGLKEIGEPTSESIALNESLDALRAQVEKFQTTVRKLHSDK